jgi:hypothetical protein
MLKMRRHAGSKQTKTEMYMMLPWRSSQSECGYKHYLLYQKPIII